MTEVTYKLEEQIGFLLRKANQRHTGIFAKMMPGELTPTRFAALSKLLQLGPLSQNELGRHTAMDSATIKGVVDRLRQRNFVETHRATDDARRQMVSLTKEGQSILAEAIPCAMQVTMKTFGNLSESDQQTLKRLLREIA